MAVRSMGPFYEALAEDREWQVYAGVSDRILDLAQGNGDIQVDVLLRDLEEIIPDEEDEEEVALFGALYFKYYFLRPMRTAVEDLHAGDFSGAAAWAVESFLEALQEVDGRLARTPDDASGLQRPQRSLIGEHVEILKTAASREAAMDSLVRSTAANERLLREEVPTWITAWGWSEEELRSARSS
jgi:hypothetical protein